MSKKKLCLLVLGMTSATQAMASAQSQSNGFIEDSHFGMFFRNGYMHRAYDHGVQNKAEWGQAATANFTSGYTEGTVGVGVDAFSMYAFRLDSDKHHSGAAGIDFFKQDDSGSPAHDLFKSGAALKLRVSNTVLKYGDQMPSLPVLSYDNTRLLPESYTGTMLTSRELKGLELNVGHFTEESRKSAEGHDSGGLGTIDVAGGRYTFNDQLSGAFYASDVEDVLKKKYVNLNYTTPLQADQSLTFDFNGYKTRLDKDYSSDGDRDNKIWSLAATYTVGAHSFMIAHQRSTGDMGYPYGWYQSEGGVGDGGTTIWLANSYWSDFNAEDERSWQLSYALDFATYGVPGLTYRIAYVRGDNIKTDATRHGNEEELFNQVQYVVQNGPAKDLTLRLRSSFLHVSRDASAYNTGGTEVRAFVEYPLDIL